MATHPVPNSTSKPLASPNDRPYCLRIFSADTFPPSPADVLALTDRVSPPDRDVAVARFEHALGTTLPGHREGRGIRPAPAEAAWRCQLPHPAVASRRRPPRRRSLGRCWRRLSCRRGRAAGSLLRACDWLPGEGTCHGRSARQPLPPSRASPPTSQTGGAAPRWLAAPGRPPGQLPALRLACVAGRRRTDHDRARLRHADEGLWARTRQSGHDLSGPRLTALSARRCRCT